MKKAGCCRNLKLSLKKKGPSLAARIDRGGRPPLGGIFSSVPLDHFQWSFGLPVSFVTGLLTPPFAAPPFSSEVRGSSTDVKVRHD
jgi:hypothetical protein